MKRRSFFGLVSGLMAGCMMPWRITPEPIMHFRTVCKNGGERHWEYKVDNQALIPSLGSKYPYPSEWTDISNQNVNAALDGFKEMYYAKT